MVTLTGNLHPTVPAPCLNTACTAMTMNSNSTWQDSSGSNKLSSNGPQMNIFTSSEKHMQRTTTVISAKTGFQPHSTRQIGLKDQKRNTLPAILLEGRCFIDKKEGRKLSSFLPCLLHSFFLFLPSSLQERSSKESTAHTLRLQ